MKRTVQLGGVSLCAAALMALAACGSGAQSGAGTTASGNGTIVIGFSDALSGAVAVYGTQARDTMKAYFDQVNAHGGVNGEKIDFIPLDDQASTSTSASNTVELITQDKAIAVMGDTLTSTCAASTPIAEQYKVALICNNIDPAQANPVQQYAFGTGALALQAVNPEVALTKKLVAGKKPRIAVITSDTPGDVAYNKAEAAAVKAQGWTVSDNEEIPLSTVDTSPFSAKVISSKPDIVWLTALSSVQPPFVQALRNSGINVPILVPQTTGSYLSLQTIAAPSFYILDGSAFVTPSTTGAGAQAYVKLMKSVGVTSAAALNGASNRVQAYLAAVAVVDALKACGKSCTATSLASSLQTVKLNEPGLTSNFAWSATSHVAVTGLDAWHWNTSASQPQLAFAGLG